MNFKAIPKRWLIAMLLVAVAVLAIGYRASMGKAVPTLLAKRQPLTETVVSSGRVITPRRIDLGAEMVGNLAEVTVEEGDRVRAGQVLARIDDGEQQAASEQARRALEESEARLAQLAEVSRPVADQALKQAEANLAQASSEFGRVKKLVDAGFYNQSRLDEARRVLDAAQAMRDSATAQSRGNRPDGVETRLALARRDQARAALNLTAAKQANTVIRAPVASLVVRKWVEPGDIVTQGKKLFELAADGETQIVLQADEKNLGRLAVGQSASVLADAYPGQPFAAEVFHIAPAVDAQKGSVEVKLRVAAPPTFVKPDMTVSVEIRVGHRADALTLPGMAVRDLASQPWVMVIEEGRAVRRAVKIGFSGAGWVEVVDGLKVDEPVIPPTAKVAEGQKARAGR